MTPRSSGPTTCRGATGVWCVADRTALEDSGLDRSEVTEIGALFTVADSCTSEQQPAARGRARNVL